MKANLVEQLVQMHHAPPGVPRNTEVRVAVVAALCWLAIACAQGATTLLPDSVRLVSGWELQDIAKVQEKGEVISHPEFKPGSWHRATVPGTVLTSLVDDSIYPEPLYGENNRPDKIPDSLCRTAYWYHTTFTPPPSYTDKQVWLNFNGINYIADIWVNGHQVGTIKGAFIRGIFNITSLIALGRPNGLAVLVHPQPHPGETHEKTVAKGTGPNGGVTGLDGPTFLCSIGWDWIPTIRDRNTGIWQDVFLSATGPVVLKDPFVTSRLPLPRTDTAEVTVEVTVSNATDLAQSGQLAGAIGPTHFEQNVSVGPNESKVVTFSPATTPTLRLHQPRLWWPNGFGPQNLYQLHLSFLANRAVSDVRDVNFGIRQLGYSVPGSSNLTLSVNGVPVMAKGGDWGLDEALKRIPRKRLDAAVRMHQVANYTMIRNWVGQSTSPELYDLCDQYGILLWDEFFEPHPVDGPIPQDVELYLDNVRDKILRFRTHPCIALWCARNEGDPPPAIGDGIQKLISALDPGRLYQPSSTSGRGVNSGGPYHWRTPREFYSYNEAFKTEIGSVSVPTLEAIHAMMPSQDWEIINDDWAEHDFCGGAQQGDYYADIISSRYGRPINLVDFVRKSQLANYECFRAMYEGRFAKLFNPETGVITWMSHPAQPSFVWQLYSHDLEPNSSLFAVRKACEPVHIQLNQNDWHVMVINNTPRALEGLKLQTMVYNLDGKLQLSREVTLTATGSAASDAGPVVFPKRLSQVHFVKCELRHLNGQLISDNFYWRADPQQEDDFRALNNLPMVALDIQAKRYQVAANCVLDVALHNPSPSIALMAHLQLRKGSSGQRILPVFYSDNYVSLVPGETKSLTIDAAVTDLNGEEPLIAIDGWNVTAKPAAVSANEVQIAPNQDAIIETGKQTAVANDASETIRINCGGGHLGFFKFGSEAPPDEFSSDRDYKGGEVASTKASIDARVPNAAPTALYQTERWGPCIYVVPVKKNLAYTVRLHFVETRFPAKARKFNVDINGNRVLADFDIAAEVAKDKALVKEFGAIAADASGHITIAFTRGSAGQPVISGIEILR